MLWIDWISHVHDILFVVITYVKLFLVLIRLIFATFRHMLFSVLNISLHIAYYSAEPLDPGFVKTGLTASTNQIPRERFALWIGFFFT